MKKTISDIIWIDFILVTTLLFIFGAIVWDIILNFFL
jgi:hypothetical protein